jgi:hypothetical protein
MKKNSSLPDNLKSYRKQNCGSREIADTRPKVECEIQYLNLCSNGFWREGVQVICSKCGQTSESFGTKEKSIKRCLAILADKCLIGENNFYVQKKDQ